MQTCILELHNLYLSSFATCHVDFRNLEENAGILPEIGYDPPIPSS
jgi:hypothetical protein